MKKYLVFWKTYTWTVFILVLFLIPSRNIPGSREIAHLDKVVHMVFFMIFTVVFIRDIVKIKGVKYISPVYMIITFLLVLFLAMMVELLQEKMKLGREGDIIDIVYDLIGYIFGMLFLVLKYGFRTRSL